MRDYLIKRLLLIILTLFLVSTMVFLMIRLIPGDILDSQLREMSAHGGTLDREGLKRLLGVDVPIHVQYGRWMKGIVLHGDLGVSLRNGEAVTTKILGRMPVTFELGILGVLMAMLYSVPIGVYSAIRQDSTGDYVGRSISIILISVPSFWVATVIILYPSIWWQWTPSLEYIPLMEDPLGNLGMMAIPAFLVSFYTSGAVMRMTRTMMLEVLRQDYIRTAGAKGLKERVVVTRHALKNALIPVVTIVGLELPIVVGGTVIMEQIFALPGMGRLFLDSLQLRDYTMISGINLVIATVVIGSNLLVDLTYAWLDPRVVYK